MITVGVRTLLLAFAGLTALAFVVLFLAAERTAEIFAWTIQPAATAAFLGAAYAAGCVLVALSLLRPRWSRVRIGYLTVLVFAWLTLAATLLHLDKFHFARAESLPRFAAVFWLVIYIVVPVAMLVLLLRGPAQHPEQLDQPVRIPRPVAVLLGIQGVVFGLVGLILFLAPPSHAFIWPWTLTPLTGRMVAAWLLAFAVGIALALRGRDLALLTGLAAAYAVLAILQLVVVVRFADVVRWQAPATWGYLVLLVSVAVSAAYGLSRLRGTETPAT